MKSLDLDNKILLTLKKKIRLKKVQFMNLFFSNIEIKNIKGLIKKFTWFFRKDLENFKIKLSKYTNSKYVVVLNSGTSALHLALKTIGIKKNDEVLMPSLNYIALS